MLLCIALGNAGAYTDVYSKLVVGLGTESTLEEVV